MPIFILVITLLLFLPTPSFAYLDPATGSMIIQGIIGAVAGLLIAAKFYWHKIKSFFSHSKQPDAIDASDEEDAEADRG